MKQKNAHNRYKIIKLLGIVCLLSFAIITQTGCGSKEPVSKTEYCLNTTCTITLYDVEKKRGEKLLDDVFQEIRKQENLLSKTVEGSDIYKINHAKGAPVEVSKDTWIVVESGIGFGEFSDGAFDITVGKVMDLWDFTGDHPKVPDEKELQEALKTVDYRQIETEVTGDRQKKYTIRLTNPEAQIDLGGIAKGCIADRAAAYLEDHGVKKAMVNLGGNVVAVGEKEQDTPWNIGIERPFSDHTELIGSVKVTDATVVTSGIYERKFEEKGKLYHHVLDPKTGYPSDSDLEAVTVTAPRGEGIASSMLCDSLSTTFLILGREKSEKLIRQFNEDGKHTFHVEAAFIGKDGKVVQTDGMNAELNE